MKMKIFMWISLIFASAALVYYLKVMLGIYIDIEVVSNLKPCH